MQIPMSEEGKVAWPELQPVPHGQWKAKEFATMPGFNEVPNGVGAEEAKD